MEIPKPMLLQQAKEILMQPIFLQTPSNRENLFDGWSTVTVAKESRIVVVLK